jgi:hypothetical protein
MGATGPLDSRDQVSEATTYVVTVHTGKDAEEMVKGMERLEIPFAATDDHEDDELMERLAQAVYREVRRWSEAGHIRYHLSWEDAPSDRRERMRDVVRAVLREMEA